MLSKREFDSAMATAAGPVEKVMVFGAVLARATRPGPVPVVVGGSAITVITGGWCVSGDIDVVGPSVRIVPVLQRWGFRLEPDPDGRRYGVRREFGLVVDVLHRASGSGRSGPLRTFQTMYGPVRVSAIEDLIVRRLVFWQREGRTEYMDQAVMLRAKAGRRLDSGYIEGEIRYEKLEEAYAEMNRRARAADLRSE
ncbi:MAG: hypothetical protein ACREDK_09090 [Thermoplasmata archaeon]